MAGRPKGQACNQTHFHDVALSPNQEEGEEAMRIYTRSGAQFHCSSLNCQIFQIIMLQYAMGNVIGAFSCHDPNSTRTIQVGFGDVDKVATLKAIGKADTEPPKEPEDNDEGILVW